MSDKRFSFIINPKFQYNFSFYVCLTVLLSGLIYLLTIWDLFETFIPYFPKDSVDDLLQNRQELLIILGVIQLAYLGIVFAITLILTHRIAGPMYKIGIYLQSIREGASFYPLTFRKGDKFPEVAEEITETVDYLLQRDEDEIEYLQEIAAYIENISLVVPDDKKPVLKEIQRKIQDLQD